MRSAELRVPDETALSGLQKLCDVADPYAVSDELDQLFVEAMRESIAWHRSRNAMYDKLLSDAGFAASALKSVSDLERLPFIPAAAFKEHEILSVSRESIFVHLTSSGTNGQKSQIFFDEWSIGSAQTMLDKIFSFYKMDVHEGPVGYLLYTYEPSSEMKLGTSFTDHYLCKYAPASEVFYALKSDGRGGHEFDLFGCIEFLERFNRSGQPVRILGFPSFLHFTVERMQRLARKPLRLHPDSLVFLGGGWKNHADQEIQKSSFYKSLVDNLGFRDERLRDGFGSVEHCIPYVECPRHRFHVPVWSRVLIRDVRNLRPLPYGEAGFLQFISPYITSVPAHAVLMGDLAIANRGVDCGCGLKTDWFEIKGRAGTAKNRSCAVAAAELLKGRV